MCLIYAQLQGLSHEMNVVTSKLSNCNEDNLQQTYKDIINCMLPLEKIDILKKTIQSYPFANPQIFTIVESLYNKRKAFIENTNGLYPQKLPQDSREENIDNILWLTEIIKLNNFISIEKNTYFMVAKKSSIASQMHR